MLIMLTVELTSSNMHVSVRVYFCLTRLVFVLTFDLPPSSLRVQRVAGYRR